MRHVSKIVLLVTFWVLAIARAQTSAPNATTLSPDRVTFYTEPNFAGDALIVEAGASVPDLGKMLRPNQQPWIFAVSSVKVEGAAKATVFSGVGFSADRLDINTSIPDLYAQQRGRDGATWDRAIASVNVSGPPRMTAPPPPPPVRYETTPPAVVFVPTTPPPHVVHGPPPRARIDLRAVDLMIHRAYREVLRRNADADGLRTYRERVIHDGWTEEQIIRQLQRSHEARSVNADEAITKAYREVLGRDPDPNGMAHYRAKWRDGWTQGQIRDDLRRSQEGRSNYIHGAITRAYRDLLGREPDPSGYAHFERAMRERGWTERDVRQNIMQGEEYRQRQGKR